LTKSRFRRQIRLTLPPRNYGTLDGSVRQGKMIDASIVEVPIQRNSREENQQLNSGTIPDDWKESPGRICRGNSLF
jgi:hypothetical protein